MNLNDLIIIEIFHENCSSVQYLIDKKVDINNEGINPMAYAIAHNKNDIIDLLLKNNFNFKEWKDRIIRFMCMNGCIDATEKFVNLGLMNYSDMYNSMRIASRNGQNKFLKYMIDNKVHVSECHDVVQEAGRYNHISTLELLIKYDNPLPYRLTAVFLHACVNGKTEMVKMLIEHNVLLEKDVYEVIVNHDYVNRQIKQMVQDYYQRNE
jgi:ankyrin repeat protein